MSDIRKDFFGSRKITSKIELEKIIFIFLHRL